MCRRGKHGIARIALTAAAVLLLSQNAGAQAMRGQGDFEFFLDTTALPVEGAGTLELFQLAIPVKEITYEEKDGAWRASVKIELRLARDGEKVYEKGRIIEDVRDVRPSAADLSGFIYLSDSVSVEPGTYELDVRVEDLNERKKTLLGLLRNRHDYSRIEGEKILIRGFPQRGVALSDPVFLWSREGDRFIPNPMQIYGLKNETLSFFSSVAVFGGEADSLDYYIWITDHRREVVDSMAGRIGLRDSRGLVYGSFDVNKYPAGSYRVMVNLVGGELPPATSGKDFNVAWELINWQKPRRDVLVEARLLLNDTEFEGFREMSIGEQESALNAYWKELDPTPHTSVNETYEIFRNRVAWADNAYGQPNKRGALTDRGQIYIRFGPPDDIEQESVPFNREDLGEALDKLEDRYKVIIHGTMKGPGTEYAMVQDATSSITRPFRGGGMDTGGFELWIYTLKGDPLLPQDQVMTLGSGLRFLFVDKDGVGNYRLVGTSEEQEGLGTGSSQAE